MVKYEICLVYFDVYRVKYLLFIIFFYDGFVLFVGYFGRSCVFGFLVFVFIVVGINVNRCCLCDGLNFRYIEYLNNCDY